MAEGQPSSVPYLRVVRGDATAAEIAALVAILAAVGAARSPDTQRPAAPAWSDWNSQARLLRAPLRAAPGAWRRSSLP